MQTHTPMKNGWEICYLKIVISEKNKYVNKQTSAGSTCPWMTGLFGAEQGLFLLWLQVPKEPRVPTFTASESGKYLIPVFTPLPLLTS